MKLILSTSNVVNDGPSLLQKSLFEKSNAELVNSLRANFLAAQEAVAYASDGFDASSDSSNSNPSSFLNIPASRWTTRSRGAIYIPSVDFASSGLVEERSQYEITVKFFFLPSTDPSRRREHVREAIDLVLKELHVTSIDLFVVSFPNISFDADDDDEDDMSNYTGSDEDELDAVVETWHTLEEMHSKKVIAQLGLAEFGSERLARLLDRVKVRPSVDQINVRDCCVVPKPLILFARQENIELLTHNDCTNILPRGTTRDLLGSGDRGAGVLGTCREGGLLGDIEPQWVVKYTAVVKNRGVIENKGYFAMANLI